MMKISIIILAAGKGTRMDSETPKVLHKLNHKSLIKRVVETSMQLNPLKIVIVIGYKKELIKKELKNYTQLEYATQLEQKGTGHAVKMCFDNLKDFTGDVLILSGSITISENGNIFCVGTPPDIVRIWNVIGISMSSLDLK